MAHLSHTMVILREGGWKSYLLPSNHLHDTDRSRTMWMEVFFVDTKKITDVVNAWYIFYPHLVNFHGRLGEGLGLDNTWSLDLGNAPSGCPVGIQDQYLFHPPGKHSGQLDCWF